MKAHLYISDDPLHDGQTVKTLCDLTIFQAKAVLMWDSVAMNSPLALNTLRFCKKCADAYISASPGRYVFGICEFREAGKESEKVLEAS